MRYVKKPVASGVTRFTKAPMSEVEFSRMKVAPDRYTTFNAGDIVPLYYAEVLPHDTFDISVDYVLRQLTLLKPAMGNLTFDIYAFWVSNQTVNESWKNVQGENTSGVWSAPEVELSPLLSNQYSNPTVRIPVGSLADYYGFPTQAPILASHLKQCNDLKFRGYVEIYNDYFRDQNYQAPKPYSRLNVYNGFLDSTGDTGTSLLGVYSGVNRGQFVGDSSDGSYPNGAILKAVMGEGYEGESANFKVPDKAITDYGLQPPFKANKFHDPFTSALPSPQKGQEVIFNLGSDVPVTTGNLSEYDTSTSYPLYFRGFGSSSTSYVNIANKYLKTSNGTSDFAYPVSAAGDTSSISGSTTVFPANLYAKLSEATQFSINDLRNAVATQQVYETLARGGTRYLEIIRSFFEIETETPFSNMPIQLGHVRNVLDAYQVAQTSGSVEGETPQGNLSAYGYTTKGGHLFHRTFLEHGYIHILGVVRQKNMYTTYLAPDNFRRSTLDFYLPQLANIGEQPIPLRTLNPFISGHDDAVIAYQEAWWEYRYEPDLASGYFRQGLEETLTGWTYGDPYDPNFTHVNGEWLKSNAQEVVDKTLTVTSELAHQFFGVFTFTVDKQRPMPIYSVPGLDTI